MIIDITYSSLLSNRINYLDSILLRKYNAVIIRDIFEKNKVEDIKKRIADFSNEQTIKSFGNILGHVLHNAGDFEEYIKKSEQFVPILNNILNTDFKSWYENLFLLLNPSKPVLNAHINNNYLLAANIKLMDAGLKGLEPHNELSLYNEIPSISILKDFFHIDEQLSFYVQISKPQAGGRLILYNFYYKNNFINKLSIHHPLVRFILFFKKKQVIDLNEGDAILFNAGRVWHKIENLKGSKKRITIQNFINLSFNKKTYSYWT